jgi:Uma2 family endonuclease
MSTVDRPQTRVLPLLEAGQRLDQPTFHERYAAMGEGKWFELIEGVVYMVYPAFEPHGGRDSYLGWWIVQYRRSTPGLESSTNVSTIPGEGSEVQPDQQLRISERLGGRAHIEGGYVVGPPELVVEVGDSSRSKDLGPKKAVYEAAGVTEYLFIGIDPREIRWFVLRDGTYQEMAAGEDGFYKSEVFPGLWLDPKALFEGDLDGLAAGLEQGLASDDHARFVAELRARGA